MLANNYKNHYRNIIILIVRGTKKQSLSSVYVGKYSIATIDHWMRRWIFYWKQAFSIHIICIYGFSSTTQIQLFFFYALANVRTESTRHADGTKSVPSEHNPILNITRTVTLRLLEIRHLQRSCVKRHLRQTVDPTVFEFFFLFLTQFFSVGFAAVTIIIIDIVVMNGRRFVRSFGPALSLCAGDTDSSALLHTIVVCRIRWWRGPKFYPRECSS